MRIPKALTVASGVLAVVALAGCVGDDDVPTSAGSKTLLLKHLEARHDMADYVMLQQRLIEYLPNTRFAVDGKPAASAGGGVAAGKIERVEAGRAYRLPDAKGVAGVPVAYDSPDAQWRTLDVTIAIDRAYGDVAGESTVRFGVSIGSALDPATAIVGLEEMGQVVVALEKPGFYEYDKSLYSVSQIGGALGTVRADGTIEFPILENTRPNFADGAATLTDLERASKAPGRSITVRDWTRVG